MFPYNDSRGRLFDQLLRMTAPMAASQAGVFPQVNIYDDGERFLVRAEMPGIDKESLDITTRRDHLTIRGARQVQAADGGANYHRRERESGQFRRTLALPQPVDADKVNASYKNGVLEIVLPRAPEAKQRKISIA